MSDADEPEVFKIAPNTAAAVLRAETLFASLRPKLAAALPDGCDIRHIGATAIPGCLTKGDLDIVVRVEARSFVGAEQALAGLFMRNEGSVRTPDFAAFMDDVAIPPLGVQLVVLDSAFDNFHRFTERLLADPALVVAYNALKQQFVGQPMDAYRAAKSAFVEQVLGEPTRDPAR